MCVNFEIFSNLKIKFEKLLLYPIYLLAHTVKPTYNSHPGGPKKWPLYRSGRSLEVFQSKLFLKLVWPDLFWPLLTDGHYSEVVVNTGLTVLSNLSL